MILRRSVTMLIAFLRKKISFAPKVSTFSSISSAAETLTPKSHLITDYLIKSCGFSPQRAITVSKRMPGLRTFGKAESVRHFLKYHGLTDANIRSIICASPRIIGADVEHTLQPNLVSLRQMGFSEIELQKVIIRNPQAILNSSSVSRIEFWKTLLNNDMKSLGLALGRNRGLLNGNNTSVALKIAFLKGYGLSDVDIGRILVMANGFFLKSIASMDSSLKRVEELGIRRGSSMFLYGLAAIHCVGVDALKSKMNFFMSYGWSEQEFIGAVQKFPALVRYSVENMKEKMEFLVGRAGCKQSYIVSRPAILCYSLEKRLTPRYHVMNILRSNASMHRERDLYKIMACTEEYFLQKIIFKYMDQVPTLHNTYIAACLGKIPL